MTTFKLGRYEITGRIASGGMATVYRARLQAVGGFTREFALKVIHPHLVDTPGFVDRFHDEARVASRVRHPNVVATVDVDDDRGYHFLVLELIDGLTVRQIQNARRHPLAAAEAARIVADVATGLHAVHTSTSEQGSSLDVIHRDVSPHNIMLDNTGRAILIDLGLAKSKGQLGHTETGVLAGKLPYMSPEQSQLRALDARSDVFSLGTVLFELTVGEMPFGDDHTPGTLEKIRVPDHADLRARLDAAHVPDWLTEVITTCLQPEPDDRYSTAQALGQALREAMESAQCIQAEVRGQLAAQVKNVQAKLPEPTLEPLPPRIKSRSDSRSRGLSLGRPGLLIAGALVLLVAVVAGTSARRSMATQEMGPDAEVNLAADSAAQSKASRTIPDATDAEARSRRSPLASQDTESDTEGAPEDVDAAPGAKAKKRRGKRHRLKQNPYE